MTRASFKLSILLGTFCLFNYCFCDIENVDLLKCYKEYFNKENSNFTYEDGILYNVERQATTRYKIEITIKVKEQANPKSFRLLKCTATLNDDAGTLTVVENQCDDGTNGGHSANEANEAADVSSELEYVQDETTELSTTESEVGRQAVNLDSEVQADNAQINSSGEQFVAIPRPQSSSPCIGCTSLVDNNAPGVDVLANLAVRHLNKHTPDIVYKLKSIVQVERQVQIVNGVRYILTIDVSPSNCEQTPVEDCSGVKTCKVSILEKPWLKMPNGKKFRAVLSNNCTEQWLFGEDGEELSTKDDDVINSDDEVIKASKIVDVQAMPNTDKTLTNEELKDLEEQIIPTNEIERQKREIKNEAEEVLDPRSTNLLSLAIKAFDEYSSKKGLRIYVVYATRQLSANNNITRIDFNARVLEPTPNDDTNEVNKRCHTRVSENEKSFYTYCALMDDGFNKAIEIPASNPKWRPVTQEKLHSEYGDLLQIDEIIRVYDSVIFNSMNIIFDTKSVNNAYRCHLIIQGNTNVPLLCKRIEHSAVNKIEKDPTDLKYLHLASEALKKYLSSSNITEPYIVAAVLYASELDGPLTYINIDFIAVDFDDTLRCISQIQENIKSAFTKIAVNCSKTQQRKDYPPEVIIKRDPLDHKYVKIAKEALKTSYSHLDYSNESLEVVYANEQIVRGVITRLDLDVKEANNATIYRCHVKLYEKPSDNIRELNIDCFPKALNLIGGRFEQNASNPRNWKYAKESLVQKYNSSLSLLDVVRVTTTAMGLAETDFYAISDPDKVLHLCHVSKLDQSWDNKSELNVECKPKNAKPIPILGGIVETDPSDPRYKAIAIEALAKEPRAYPKESIKIVYSNENLVSGVITRLDFDIGGEQNVPVYRCHVKLFDQPWAHVRELNIDCFPKTENLLGGLFEQNASDPKNWEYAKESLVKKYNSSLSLTEVVRVTTASDGLAKTDFYAISDSDKVLHLCHASKLEQPWNNISELKVECKPKNAKPIPILGGIVETDPSDPKYKAIAIEALAKEPRAYPKESIKIVYSNENLVSGVITRLDFDIGGEQNVPVYRCHVKLFDQPWEHVRELNIDCFPKTENLLGGLFEQNASDPKNWEYAKESLVKKYNSSLSLTEVVRVTTASDGLAKTDFYAISDSDKVLHLCHASKLEQPWNNISELKVECKPKNAKPIPILGGIVETDPSDPRYKAIAIEALAKEPRAYPKESIKIVYSNENLVSGVITRLDFDIGGEQNVPVYRCHVKLFDQPWAHVRELNIDCFPKTENLPGGLFEQNASDPKNWEYAKESLVKKYNSSLSLTEVVRVTTASQGLSETDFYAISDSDKVLHLCHASKLEQPWNNISELKVECKPKNAKPIPILGGIVETDPSDPKYKAIAIEALAKEPRFYSNESIRIVYANEALVSGVVTRLDFDVKEAQNASVFRCHVRLYEKPWEHVRELNIDCFPKHLNLPGGRFEQNASDPRNWHDARRSLAKQFGDSLSLIDVLRVTTRDVNGGINETDFDAISISNSVLYRCHVTIFMNLWDHFKDTELSCRPVLHKQINSKITGGKEKRDPSDPKFFELATKSLAKFLTTTNSSKPYRVAQVTHATEQVTVGLSTDIHFIAVLDNNRDILKCFSNIFDSFVVNRTVIKVHCSSIYPKTRSKRMPGSKQNRDPNNPKYLTLAKKALSQYLNIESVETQYKITIDEVTTQVVAGLSTDINFTAIAVDNSNGLICHSNVWEKGSINNIIINVNCNQVRKKRHDVIVGGKTLQNPKNPKYLVLARQSFNQYLGEKNADKHLISIEKVTTQVVAGESTEIDFIATSLDKSGVYTCHSRIWEKPWENFMDINVNCSPLETAGRKKRENLMPGGKTLQNPNDPKYLSLARQSLSKYLKRDDVYNDQITVEKVTTQVVAGILTEIDFVVISLDNSGVKCHSKIWEKPWENFMDIDVNCSPIETTGRKKRDNLVPGGKTPQNPNDPKYLSLARQSLRKYLKRDDVNNQQITIEKVTTQVVAGIITEIDFITRSQASSSGYKICHSSIFEKVWENFMDIDVNCSPIETAGRKKRENDIPGGKTEQDPKDPKYLELAKLSFSQYLEGKNADNHQISVEKVTTQVVAGINTEIDFIAKSMDNSGGYICHSTILESAGQRSISVDVDCSPFVNRKKRHNRIVGGKTPQDTNDPKYLSLARQSLSKYLKRDDVNNHQITIEMVTTQVVAGISTEIDFIAKSLDNSGVQKCHSSILERAWENLMNINVNCSPLDTAGRKKRDNLVPGGKTPQNPNDPKYLSLARQSLSQYLKQDDVNNDQITVEKVTTQVVAGILTEIDFVAKSLDNSGVKCHSRIWEKPWEKFMDIDVNCSPLETTGRKKRENVKSVRNTTLSRYDLKVKHFARESLSKFLKQDDVKNRQIRIKNATEQVIADGIIMEIDFIGKSLDKSRVYKCHSRILEKPWKVGSDRWKDMNVNCSSLETTGRKKRENDIPGGKTAQDPKDPKYLDLAKLSFSQYLEGKKADNHQISVEQVTTQVVAGISTEIDFIAKSLDNSGGYMCHSTILESAGQRSISVDVDCSPFVNRKRRHDRIVGGKTPQDTNDPKYLSLARQSLSKYLKRDDVNNHQITIEKVTTQVVAGISTEIDFIAKSLDNSGVKCHSRIWEKPWEKFMDIDVNCSPIETTGRKKRENDIPGGKTEQDPKDPKYLDLAKLSFIQYLEGKYADNHQISVERVTTQVVAGKSTEIDFIAKSLDNSGGYKCHSTILESAGQSSISVDVDCRPFVNSKKRDTKLVGRKPPPDPNNPEFVSLAKKALHRFLRLKGKLGSEYKITILKVTTPPALGRMTLIDFVAEALDHSGSYKCESSLWEKPWQNNTIVDVHCTPLGLASRKKRGEDNIAGGKYPQDPNNPKYLSLARQSLSKYLKRNNVNNHQIIVEKVTTQVINGINTEIDFIARSLDNSGGYECHSSILDSAGNEDIYVKCDPLYQDGNRNIRDVKINQTKTRDPSDPKYMSLAEKSLIQYLHLEGPTDEYQITVEHVTTTVVSGLLTEIYYIAAEKKGYAAITCHSKVWEQVWLNSTKIDVECNPLPRVERSLRDLQPDNENVIELDHRDGSRNKRSIGSTKTLNGESHSLESISNEDLIIADHFANEALKHIDAKYRHPRQMKVVTIFSFAKDPKAHTSAHYRIKMEVGYTNCLALSAVVEICSLVTDMGPNKFCRVSIWLQPDRDHPPRFKVSCDIDENLIEINKKTQAEQLFFDFLVAHKPSYLNNFNEMRSRLEIFKQNIEKIHEFNTHERGTARYGVTKFTDLTDEEFNSKHLGLKPHLANSNSMTKAKIPDVALPASFDWREKGAVTEVKNQGTCGSCWAFSVTGNIEGQWKLKSGQLVSLSEQELLDCDTLDNGCGGGLPDNAYRAIEQLGGLETEQDYPYEMENEKCSFNKSLSKVQISGAVNITSNETSMAMWMVEHGPMSIGINANGMQFYFGGVSHPWTFLCNPKNLDHGVLIVGFGIDEFPVMKKSLPYWIVKNSWGTSWGEQGYYRIYRGDGSCGVNQMASSAVIN